MGRKGCLGQWTQAAEGGAWSERVGKSPPAWPPRGPLPAGLTESGFGWAAVGKGFFSLHPWGQDIWLQSFPTFSFGGLNLAHLVVKYVGEFLGKFLFLFF